MEMTGKLPKDNSKVFIEAFENFKKIGNGYVQGDKVQIEIALKTGRAFAQLGLNKVTLDKNTSIETIHHEFSHLLENNNYIRKVATDFLLRRTSGNPIKYFYKQEKYKGYGFRKDEKYIEGDFYNDYVGKIYSGSKYAGISATEVISMGVEQYMKNPFEFYKNDREHFELIHNLFFAK